MSTHNPTTAGNPNNGLIAIALIALIFGAGFASGWFVHRATTPTAIQATHQGKHKHTRKRGSWRKRFVKRLVKKLQLTTAQAQQIEAVIHKHQPKYRQIKQSIRPGLQQVRIAMRNEIKAMLNPAQQARFQQMIRANQARRKQKNLRK